MPALDLGLYCSCGGALELTRVREPEATFLRNAWATVHPAGPGHQPVDHDLHVMDQVLEELYAMARGARG
jgi:hypothetical protein